MSLKVHFLGIGGSGASAVAAIAQAQGFEVTGCDKDLSSEFLKPFSKKQLFLNHNPNHLIVSTSKNVIPAEAGIQKEDSLNDPESISSNSNQLLDPRLRGDDKNNQYVDLLVVTPAIFSLDAQSRELQVAKEKGIQIITWQQFLADYLAKDKFVITICGTHGKSTTTAMTGLMLEDAILDPTVVLGAIVPKWQANYRVGHGKYLVIEADEFNDNFLSYNPDISLVTNIEMDHPEYFADFAAVKHSFTKFLGKTTQTIIANLSDPGVKQVLNSHFSSGNTSIDYSKELIDFPLQVPGEYNIYNASAVYQLGLSLKIDPAVVTQSLQNYTGIGRRFEKIGEYNSAQIYSDFGHHPTEIKVTIEAARSKFPSKKIWVIFQPHMFSRTKALFDDFVKVFQNLDIAGTAILDIYPSREIDTGLVSSQQLVTAINKENVEYVSSWEQLKPEMEKSLGADDVVFFLGAGDTDKWAKELVNK